MAANNLGTAYIKIAPQMQGIQKSISDGLASIKTSSLPGAAAVGTVVAKGVSAAMNIVTNSLDGAIKRTDILNNFPKVMQNLGISAEDSQKAIDRLVEGLDGLPTALQDGASAVQRFTSRNNDVKKSTEIFLALNNAILAGGASAEIQASALEQMSQAYAKGKPDMMEWRTLMMAMPAQLNQVAKSMGLGESAADKLGEKLRKGEISMDAFMNEIIELNKKGSGNIASFEEQAKSSTSGIGTALTNMRNRAQKAVSSVIQSFGSKDISDAINKFSSSFTKIGDWIGSNVVPIVKNTLIPIMKNVLTAIKNVVEFIADNKWVQDTLIGVLNTIIAYKAVKTVTSIVTDFASAVVSVGKSVATNAASVGKMVASLAEAKSAGFTLTESFQYAQLSTKGLGNSMATLGANVTSTVSKFSAFGKCALAAEAVAAALVSVEMVTTAVKTSEIEATTAAREYANKHYDLKQAVESAEHALQLQRQAVQELKDAQLEATNTEIAAIEAKKRAASYQEEMNRLAAEGKQNTDEYRLAELNYTKAITEEADANKKLAETQKVIADKKEELDNLNSSNLYKANLVIGNILKERGEYGNLAIQLDALKEKTITYRDEQGNLVTASKEKSAEMIEGLASALMQGDETWRAINEKAIQEGISFTEACARYGAEGGENLVGNFKSNTEFYLPMANEAGSNVQETIKNSISGLGHIGEVTGSTFMEKISNSVKQYQSLVEKAARGAVSSAKDSAQSEVGGFVGVGKNMTQGLINGFLDGGVQSGLFGAVKRTIRNALSVAKQAADEHSPSKKTAEIGKFMVLGLAKGIDDYADDAVESAKSMTERTIAAMNGVAGLNGNMSQNQPQTALTSGMNGSGGQVIQNNEFYVDSELDVKDVSKRLGWQVATAL